MQKVAARHPDIPVVLFLGGFPQGTARQAMRASLRRQCYVPLIRSPIVPLVAVLGPVAKAQEFLDWSQSGVKLPGHPTPRADDGIAASWMKKTNQKFMVTVPSLVQHYDLVPSVKGGEKARWGEDKMRVAVLFAEDGLDYEW